MGVSTGAAKRIQETYRCEGNRGHWSGPWCEGEKGEKVVGGGERGDGAKDEGREAFEEFAGMA